MDRAKVVKEYEGYVNSYVFLTASDEYEFEMHKAVLALLKEQESWINEIAEYQQSISGSGMHELDDYEKGKWDGLQIAWNIISEGR